ncbi:MAG: chorismate mutase/prephenate dehydrogenase, partial [Gammaproteobacteria bacterium]
MSKNPPLMTLEEIRDRLDLGDSQMLEWLATRANLVREVARIKDAKGASLQAADREASMFAKKQIQCRVLGLDFDYISEIVSLMIWHSKQIECDELGR